jgi:hypothetical protein
VVGRGGGSEWPCLLERVLVLQRRARTLKAWFQCAILPSLSKNNACVGVCGRVHRSGLDGVDGHVRLFAHHHPAPQ